MDYQISEETKHVDLEIDVHDELLPYNLVLSFLQEIEQKSDIKEYCNGSNRNGRWFFQFYSKEFIKTLASKIVDCLERVESRNPILEIMAGNGKLTQFLQPFVERRIIATDAKTRRSDIAHPKWVEKLDALEAVERYEPALVLVSWEPFYSDIGVKIAKRGYPLVWIGDPDSCAVHSGILDEPYVKSNCEYALGRHDSFLEENFRTDIYIFNCMKE